MEYLWERLIAHACTLWTGHLRTSRAPGIPPPEPERDGARTAAPRPAEGAAAPRQGCGARGSGPGVCVSGRPGGGARLSAPRRPPARARSPPGRCQRRPHLAGEARGLRGVRGALRGPVFAAARAAASLCPGEAAGGAAAAAGGRLGVRSAGPAVATAAAARSERGRRPGRCRREVSAGRERAWAGGGEQAGEPAPRAGASLPPPPAPPLPASPGKFVAPALRTSSEDQPSPDLWPNRKLELEAEEAEEACGKPVRDESLLKGSAGFLDIFLGSFPPRCPEDVLAWNGNINTQTPDAAQKMTVRTAIGFCTWIVN
ncbi:uncharacterized protein [Tursiops truncatus]|uniref:uncharacterized protein n=1 Tax=Tursiops truncatus TaxID=9739 RepID=UPI003CCF9DB4